MTIHAKSDKRLQKVSKVSASQYERERLNALYQYCILDTGPEDVFDDIAKVAAAALQAPIAMITFVDKDRQWFKAKIGIDILGTSRADSFCSHTIKHQGVLTVADLSVDERFCTNPFVENEPHLRFYAGSPLVSEDGYSIGAVCVLDFKPRVISQTEAETLTRLSRLAQSQLGLRKAFLERTRLSDDLRLAHSKLSETTSLLETRFAQRTQALRVSENRFRTVVEGLEEAILITDFTNIVQYANVRITDLTGYPPDEIIGRPIHEYLDALIESTFAHQQLYSTAERHTEVWENEIKRKNGTDFWAEVKSKPYLDENGKQVGTLYAILDISERRSFQQELTRQAFCDNLTGLPNRVYFVDRLETALITDSMQEKKTGLLFIDLDNFKVINDSLGHGAGDDLLVAVAERLRSCVRPKDTLARLGGDEFVILLETLQSETEASAVAERVRVCLQSAIPLRGREVYTTASIGVSMSEGSNLDADSLLRQADIAMYRAKSIGKGSYFLFDKSMNEEARERLELEGELRAAITSSELRVHYQPIIDMMTGQVFQIEALVRWEHPVRGLLSPTKFIPLAEDSGLIVPLGLWVLENACCEAMRIGREMPERAPIIVGVNLSTRQFHEEELVEEIAGVLRKTGLPGRQLKLEITESIMMDTSDSIEKLNRLRALGVHLAVDDFGTGYSSMSYLGKFPVDDLKIDQSFISQLGRTADARPIIEAMIMLGKALGMKVTCEGIETAFQHEQLKHLGCDYGQGYHYSRPVPASDIVRVIGQIGSRDDLHRNLSKAA